VLVATALPPISDIAGPNRWLAVTLIIAMALPLVWRRRAPAAVFAVILVLALIQLRVNPHEGNDLLPLACAFYTVATREPRWQVLAGAAALEIAAALAPNGWGIYSLLIAFTLLLGYYIRTRRAYIAALVDRAERLERERDQQAQLATAAERARIAREVHDIVAHNIAVMTALADGAAYTAEASPGQGAALMRQVSETGRSALIEMRRLIGVLRDPPGHSPQPALDDIDDLLAAVREAGLPVTMTVTGQPPLLPATAQLAIYRIIQEALTNTLKYAPSSTARVQLGYQPDRVDLEISDTGRVDLEISDTGRVDLEITDTGRPKAAGPAPATASEGAPGTGSAPGMPAAGPGGGHGIAGMRERAALFAGHVTAGPAPGGGWRIHATLRPDLGPAERITAQGAGPLTAAEGS
jgi:signal transduction histidine kinase